MEPSVAFPPLVGDKNRLRVRQYIDKYEILRAGLPNCQFHARLKEDMVHALVPKLAEKAEFTETIDHGSSAQIVDLDVYVFSPGEIKRWAADVEQHQRTAALESAKEIRDLKSEVKHLRAELIIRNTQELSAAVAAARIKELEEAVYLAEGELSRVTKKLSTHTRWPTLR